ncbi:MAG: hypothetical protein J6U35_00455 [Clostridia bacterium]|nr:hypothetical protein [Clostridia bacterium]
MFSLPESFFSEGEGHIWFEICEYSALGGEPKYEGGGGVRIGYSKDSEKIVFTDVLKYY